MGRRKREGARGNCFRERLVSEYDFGFVVYGITFREGCRPCIVKKVSRAQVPVRRCSCARNGMSDLRDIRVLCRLYLYGCPRS